MFDSMAGKKNMALITLFLLPGFYQVSANRLLPMDKN